MKQIIQKVIESLDSEKLALAILAGLEGKQQFTDLLTSALDSNQGIIVSKLPLDGTDNLKDRIWLKNEDDPLWIEVDFISQDGYKKTEQFHGKEVTYYYSWSPYLGDISVEWVRAKLLRKENIFILVCQTEILDFAPFPTREKLFDLNERYPFLQLSWGSLNLDSYLRNSKLRVEFYETEIKEFFQSSIYNNVFKIEKDAEVSIEGIRFAFKNHFWLIGPLNSDVDFFTPYAERKRRLMGIND